MAEPAVALSDYALTLEAIVFAWMLQRARTPRTRLQVWFTVFFASAAVAALCGGTVHGFYHDTQNVGHVILWRATLLSTGVTALSTWAIAAELLSSRRIERMILAAAFTQLVIYSVIVVYYVDAFWIAIVLNIPAVLFLLLVVFVSYPRYGHSALLVIAFALVLTLCAALLQQFRVGLHRVYFDHNVVYHLLQAVVLYLLFLSARRLCAANSIELRGSTGNVIAMDSGGISTVPGD